jgi:hypothetical protein
LIFKLVAVREIKLPLIVDGPSYNKVQIIPSPVLLAKCLAISFLDTFNPKMRSNPVPYLVTLTNSMRIRISIQHKFNVNAEEEDNKSQKPLNSNPKIKHEN